MAGNNLVNTPSISMAPDNSLAKTFVEQGPNDKNARVDGYGGHVKPLDTQFTSVLNKYIDDMAVSYKSLTTVLGLPAVDLSNIKGLQVFKSIIDKFNPATLLKRIENGLLGGRSLGSIVEFGLNTVSDFKKDALGTLAKLTTNVNIGGLNIGKMLRTGQMAYKDARKIYQMVKNGDFTTLAGITKALDAIGYTSIGQSLKGIVDFHAMSAFLGTTIQQIVRLGNHEVVKELAAMFKDSRQRDAALSLSIYNAAARSDIEMVKTMVGIMGGGQVLSNNPEIVGYILRSYRFDAMYETTHFNDRRQELLDVLRMIDVNWAWQTINGQRVTKLDPFFNISNDAKSLLAYPSKDEHDFTHELIIANSYPAQDVKRLTMAMYKDITFKDRPLNPRIKD